MRRFTSLICCALLLACLPARAASPIAVWAHRGGAGLAPENTLGAFRQAEQMFGARGVGLEMDTQLTSDGKLVIIHDDTLDRTTNCTGAVIAHTFAEVTACDASKSFPGWGRFEPVPATIDVLREGAQNGWKIMIELKDIPNEANFDPACAAADELAKDVASSGYPLHDLIVESFWPFCLDRIKLDVANVRTLFLTTSTLPGAPTGAGFTAIENAAFSRARGYDVVSPDNATIDLSSTTVGAIRALGEQVIVWTVDTPADLATTISWGVDGLITNRPDLAYGALGGSS